MLSLASCSWLGRPAARTVRTGTPRNFSQDRHAEGRGRLPASRRQPNAQNKYNQTPLHMGGPEQPRYHHGAPERWGRPERARHRLGTPLHRRPGATKPYGHHRLVGRRGRPECAHQRRHPPASGSRVQPKPATASSAALLLNAGADRTRAPNGVTPCTGQRISTQSPPSSRHLLDAGADLTARDINGGPPCIRQPQQPKSRCHHDLLNAGADPNARNRKV